MSNPVLLTLFQLVGFLITFSFLIIIHELGHYFAAKKVKVKVEEFGIGFPPRAKELFTHAGTIFSLNWIPFGGFVRMEGEDLTTEEVAELIQPAKEIKKGAKKGKKTDESPFYEKSRLARLFVIIAGPFMNFLFGVIVFSMYFSLVGLPSDIPLEGARIGAIAVDSPADNVGIKPNVELRKIKVGDKIVEVKSAEEAKQTILAERGKEITIITSGVCRIQKCPTDELEYRVYVRKEEETPKGEGAIGIEFIELVKPKFYPWYEMPFRGTWHGIKSSFGISYQILQAVGNLVKSFSRLRIPEELASPVRIFKDGKELGYFSDFPSWSLFAAMVSFNLAVFNLLPIPVIDGGRATFILLEAVIGRKRVSWLESHINTVGFVVLVVLMFLLLIKDTWQIILTPLLQMVGVPL